MKKDEKKLPAMQNPIPFAEDPCTQYLRSWRGRIDQLQVIREDAIMNELVTKVVNETIPELEAAFKRALEIRTEYVSACNKLSGLMTKLKAECINATIEYSMTGNTKSGV